MFGLELWFVLAIFSALTGGLFIFATKVAAERNYDVVLLSTTSVALSGFFFLVITILKNDYSGLNKFVLLMILVNAIVYMLTNVLRHNAMQCIDTAIYYPIYKTLTPLFAIILGVTLFKESFTETEWIGLALSLAVPLLLISRLEKYRQKDLFRGLRLLCIAALLATVAAVAVKAGVDATSNTWLFVTLTDFGVAAVGIISLMYTNGKKPLRTRIIALQNLNFLFILIAMAILSALSFGALIFALQLGTLGLVYTIQSLYILIPIVLSIIYYHEHWNVRKLLAIVLSVAALALLK